MGLDLVYDRTQADAERWLFLSQKMDSSGWDSLSSAEKSEWLTQLKGSYNHTDLNRVGSAVLHLSDRFLDFLLHIVDYRAQYLVGDDAPFRVPYEAADVSVQPKTNWASGDPVFLHQAERYIQDLVTLRQLMPLPESTPQVPRDLVSLTISEANDIERLLDMIDDEITRKRAEIDDRIRRTAASFIYSNELCSGEVIT